MNDDIRVHVLKRKGRTNFSMRYLDPLTGKHVERSTETSNETQALKAAAKWEAELQEGRYQKPNRITWEEFREHHDTHILSGMKPSTAGAYQASLNVFERLASPQKLADITTARITLFVTAMREQGRSGATVARHLRHLKVVLRWAHRQGLLVKLPAMEIPKHAKGMRGRAITLEEFERMLATVTKVVDKADAGSWKFYLRGLWASGLRLSESLALRWDDAPGAIVVDLDGRRPMLRIPAESEKGNKHRLLPITPEFAELLETVPEVARHGYVFNPRGVARTRHRIGKRVSEIGKKAGVITDQRERQGDLVKIFATAHDLRRAFGFRWSRRVMPTVLRELMRHESLETTMKYYVGLNAEATADELWKAVENQPGDTLGGAEVDGETADSENP